MGKSRLREVKGLAQSHTASERGPGNLHPGLLTLHLTPGKIKAGVWGIGESLGLGMR